MKKIINIALALLAVAGISSCTDQDEVYKEFVKPGGYVYPEKANEMHVYPGHNRVKVVWRTPLDPSVRTGKLFWNGRQESIDINYADYAGQDSISIFVENLKEETYTFEIENYDESGNISMTSEVSKAPYADVWMATHAERVIKSAEMDAAGKDAVVTTNFTSDTKEMVYTQYRYLNKNEEWVDVEGLQDEVTAKFTMANAKPGRRFEYRSAYCPEGGVDTVWNEWRKSPTPIVGILDGIERGWEVTVPGYDSGKEPYKVLDGQKSDNFATGWYWSTKAFPCVMQIDMQNDRNVLQKFSVVNFVSSYGYRTLYRVFVAFSDEPFNTKPDASYAASTDATTDDSWAIVNEPSFAKAKWTKKCLFYNSTAYVSAKLPDNFRARYMAIVMLNQRVSNRLAIREVELTGYNLDE